MLSIMLRNVNDGCRWTTEFIKSSASVGHAGPGAERGWSVNSCEAPDHAVWEMIELSQTNELRAERLACYDAKPPVHTTRPCSVHLSALDPSAC